MRHNRGIAEARKDPLRRYSREERALTGDDAAAEARVAGMPTEEDSAFFGVTREEADKLHDIFGPIAKSVGTSFSWRREGDEIVLLVRRPGA